MARRRTVTGIRRSVGAVSKHRALSQGPPLAGESPLAAPPASLTAATSIPAPVPNAASDVAAPLTGQTAAFAVAPEDVVVHVTLVRGGITNVRVPVVIAGRYDGLPVAGSSKAFDRLLDSWITRAIDMGMVGSGLGQLFPVDLQARQAIGKANAAHLLLASMGEPGRFAQDGLRFLSSNITVAVKGLGYDQFATPLLGTRRREIPIGDAVHGVLEGILDGYERFRAIANSLIDDRERFRRAGQQPLYLVLVDPDEGKLREMQNALEVIGRERTLRGLKVDVEQGKDVPPDSIIESSAADTEQEAPVARYPQPVAPCCCSARHANGVVPVLGNVRSCGGSGARGESQCVFAAPAARADDQRGFVQGAGSLRDLLCKCRDPGRLHETDGRPGKPDAGSRRNYRQLSVGDGGPQKICANVIHGNERVRITPIPYR
jgi:hypothetical protein